MLRHLYVSNYALIDEVNVDFSNGFTAITGETGSGKSILMGALGLILGERSDIRTVKDGTDKCVVEATFDLTGFDLHRFFEEHELDYDTNTIIRREVMSNGKSRAFINDTPVQLSVLKALTSGLIDIHSQHENMLIGARSFQIGILDAFSDQPARLQAYAVLFDEYKNARLALSEILAQESRLRQDFDYHKFQYDELQNVRLDTLDEEALNAELATMTHAESIGTALAGFRELLDEGEAGALVRMNSAKGLLIKIARYSPALEELLKRMDSVSIELRDIAGEAERVGEGIVFSEERLNAINQQISALAALYKKHGASSVSQLIAYRNSLADRISKAENMDEHIAALRNQLEVLTKKLADAAGALTKGRQAGATRMEQAVRTYFKQLALDHAELRVDISESADYNSYGRDEVQWLFRANKGGQMLPVKEVASGGEISRVMLAIKAAIAGLKSMPTLILDEIDQGISGEVAMKVASVMKDMSKHAQLMAITHLPQIAGRAEHHIRVFKRVTGKKTITGIEHLEGEDRVNELAEMLSGKSAGKAAVENARELMK